MSISIGRPTSPGSPARFCRSMTTAQAIHVRTRDQGDLMTVNAREAILLTARNIAQSQSYNGLNFLDLAQAVGIKPAGIYYHFSSKADLGRFPEIFRRSLEAGNRPCLGSFVGAETDNLPPAMAKEIQAFAAVNIAWIGRMLISGKASEEGNSEVRASAIFAVVTGAQLSARSRAEISLFDRLIDSYRAVGPLPKVVLARLVKQ